MVKIEFGLAADWTASIAFNVKFIESIRRVRSRSATLDSHQLDVFHGHLPMW